MKGGADKYAIPEFRETKNNPMIPIEQKRLFGESMAEKPNPPSNKQNPILNLQMYQQKPPPKPKADQHQQYPHPAVFYPNYVPNPFNPKEFAMFMNYSRFGVPGINNMGPIGGPTFKEYNININGVSGSHIKTSLLFEDALPVKNVKGSFATMGERITMYEYIRSIMFSKGDGVDLPIDESNYNLLSHLKFMDMNPYNQSRFSNNPYAGLPSGFLLYRACYPIRHSERGSTTICAKNSTGTNVRIYRMTEGAHQVNKNLQKMHAYDLWRDMSFYDYIKDQIIKDKVCPNFVIMYGYNITIDSKIDFRTVSDMNTRSRSAQANTPQSCLDPKNIAYNMANYPNTSNPARVTDRMIRQEQIAQNRDNEQIRRGIIQGYAPSQAVKADIEQRITPNTQRVGYGLVSRSKDPRYRDYVSLNLDNQQNMRLNQMTVEQTQQMIKDEMNSYRGKALVCLTEAPNYSILGWARKEYRSEGNIQKMVNTGYHASHVWESVIFQLLAALYTMQIKGIVIRNFKLECNVFIKDIDIHNKATTYWKYRLDGIEYYVPNYKYLVLIDSNYRDLSIDVPCDKEDDETRVRTIDGKFISKGMMDDEVVKTMFETFRKVIDPDLFNQDFINGGGVPPPDKICKLLGSIKADADSKSHLFISDYIRKHMTMFLHNRVGTLLTVEEADNVMRGSTKDFRNGELVVMADQDNKERFVIHVSTSNNLSRIVTRDRLDAKANIVEKDVPHSSLLKYSNIPTDAPKQSFEPDGVALNVEPIETYTISRI